MFFRRKKPADLSRLRLNLACKTLVGEIPAGQYAMWRPTSEEPDFGTSRTAGLLDELYSLLDPLSSYACAQIARTVGWVEDHPDTVRVALPDDLTTAHVVTQDGVRLLVSASAEKGVRLHFPEETVPDVREAVLDQFCGQLRQLAAALNEQRLPSEVYAADTEPPSAWWKAMRSALAQQTGTQSIGAVVI